MNRTAACALAILGTGIVAGCGSGPTSSPATPSPSPRASASSHAGPVTAGASLSASPPAPTRPLEPVISGAPAFTYAVPAGWRLVQQDVHQVDLATGTSGSSAERIRLTLDPASEQTTGLPTTIVHGHTAYIVKDGPSTDGATYTRVWLVAVGGGLYELLCSGYSGYNRDVLTAGCDAFTNSVRFAR